MTSAERPRIGLFVTCLVDAMRPQTGFAAIALLERAGCAVEVPMAQTCCGQPGWNSGDEKAARDMALRVIEAFAPHEHVVAPSGSCAATIRDYPELFEPGSPMRARAEAMAAKTWELFSFLTDVRKWRPEGVSLPASATYHDSCSGLRHLDVKAQPRKLLAAVKGLEMRPLPGSEVCCGFGGTFCVKYPAISNAVATEKAANIESTGADLLLGGDLGCLMNMAGKLRRRGSKIRVTHAAEVLAWGEKASALGEEGAA
ncbi:(Fe-S)-binding protein [Neomegalonema sp.]|uniref:(Fe-S)-binding protein n=1 Tax=Neomegalonema sp. TaxID=2039713 RepID=UPI002621FF01|nr:(Fe-S)-binding protein [Neomegalonema sp.]MDD2870268.1 (Fe-S)-binding protein [Neomegalonema sp.]